MNLTLALPILLIPFLGTVLGAGFVLFLRESPSEKSTKALLGFASGVMVAAAVWSLLIPAIGMNESAGKMAAVPVAAGFLLGIGFLLLMDIVIPHLHVGTDSPEGPRSRLSRTAMLALAVTLHNIPEGMAVGVVIAGAIEGAADISMAGAVALAAGIALQNVPEGAIISMPLRNEGNSRLRSFDNTSRHPHRAGIAGTPGFRGRGNDLCGGRGTHPGGVGRQPFQHRHHRIRGRLRPDDGARHSIRLIINLIQIYHEHRLQQGTNP